MSVFLGIEHTAVAAKNTVRLAEWYCAQLGFSICATFDNGPDKPKAFMLRGVNGNMLEVIPADPAIAGHERPNTEPGFAHLAIQVSDFDAAAAALANIGARKEGAERAAPGGSRVQFYRDPEGNLFHLLWRPRPLA